MGGKFPSQPRFRKRRRTLFILWLSWLAVEVLSPWCLAGCTKTKFLSFYKSLGYTIITQQTKSKTYQEFNFSNTICNIHTDTLRLHGISKFLKNEIKIALVVLVFGLSGAPGICYLPYQTRTRWILLEQFQMYKQEALEAI